MMLYLDLIKFFYAQIIFILFKNISGDPGYKKKNVASVIHQWRKLNLPQLSPHTFLSVNDHLSIISVYIINSRRQL